MSDLIMQSRPNLWTIDYLFKRNVDKIETLINAGMVILVAIAILFIIPVAAIVITLASIPCSIFEAVKKKGITHE